MAGTTTNVIATVSIVTLGKWSNHETLDSKIFFGAAVMAVFFAYLATKDEEFAGKMSALVLASAFGIYSIDIWNASGLSNRGKQ